MKKEQDYLRDIAEIRNMMENSSKFLSLSGWAGILAGIYALAGACVAYWILDFNPQQVGSTVAEKLGFSSNIWQLVLLGLLILVLALGTAIYFSHKNAEKRGEKLWTATSRRLLFSMSVPLVVGGLLLLILISREMNGLIAPLSLIFYGLALYNASKFTFNEVRTLAYIEIALGLLGCYFIGYGLLLWALGFGIAHIVYGIFIHYNYEK